MSTRPKYWVVHARTMNFDLMKDLGIMPHVLSTEYGYESRLATYKNDDYSWSSEIGGTEIVFIKRIFGEYIDTALFIVFHARAMDVLHLEHLHRNKNLIYGFIYKFLNPRGFLYYKLDASPHIMEALVNRPKKLRSRMKTWLLNRMMRCDVDLVSVEAKKNYQRLLMAYPEAKSKILHLPNGFYIKKNRGAKTHKKNMIFTAGRIGARQKASEVLLEAFAHTESPHDWRLVLAGPIENGFQREIDRFFRVYPNLRERVDFLGYITDRQRLYKLYEEAKIFCFPSRWEGFSHAVIEAAYFGDYIIATDVGGVEDALEVTKYGCIVPFDDSEALGATLQEVISKWQEIERPVEEIQQKVEQGLSWKAQCGRLVQFLERRKGADSFESC